MLTVIGLDNKEYTAISEVPRVQRVNGEREITLSFLHGEINDEFLSEIETGWKANFKGDIYHLFNEKEDKHGNKEFDAVLDFFHHFNGRWHVDEVEDKSMTINDSIRPLFDDSDYVLQIIDNFYANTMSLSKQQNSTERFLYFIGRHKAEFNIPIGTKTVQIRNKIGVQRNDVLIHEDDNLIDFNINTDTGSFCTAIRYYYDFKSTGEGESETEKEPTKNDVYISPMANKYGVHYGEPIYDERFSVKANAEQAAKEKQESTWQSSFEIGAELFETPLGIGDEVPFVVPSKSINGYIRVVEINEVFDEDGDLIEATYTFGNENIANQYRKMQYDAIQDVQDMLNGKRPIPYSVLPKAIREATNIINAGDTTQFYYRADGIYGYNTDNKNWVVRMNANGLGYSTDGGQTYSNAITHLGVVTEALTAGTIDANRITIKGAKGTNRIEIDGDKIKVWDSTNLDVYTEMSKGRIHANHGALSVSRPDAYIDSNGKKWGYWIQDGMPQADSDLQRDMHLHYGATERTETRYALTGRDTAVENTAYTVERFYTSHKAKTITVGLGLALEGANSSNITVEVQEINGPVVASLTQFVRRDEPTIWRNLTFDIGVPDFSTNIAYYIKISSSILYPATRALLTVNRVSMKG